MAPGLKNYETKNACPFCGVNNTMVLGPETAPDKSTFGMGYQTQCAQCGARGPCCMPTKKGAVGAWDYGAGTYRRPMVKA